MTNKPLGIADFLRLVIEALNAAGVEYLIGAGRHMLHWDHWSTDRNFDPYPIYNDQNAPALRFYSVLDPNETLMLALLNW